MGIIDAIKACFRFIRNLIRYVVQGILNFAKDVVGWFKKIYNLDQEKDTPFIADASKFKDMLKTAPVKNVGIFQGVYDEEQDEIREHRYIDADAVDNKTKSVLGNDSLVVLS